MVKLIFGGKLRESKLCLLENTASKNVLIIGGGDGLDYTEIAPDISGEYWELSGSMLKKAKANLQLSQLDFHLGNFKAGKKFDEVWLHFVLDTMPDDEITSFLVEIKKSLSPRGRIFLADFFSPKKRYQRILTCGMISLFRAITGHRRANLPDYEKILFTENWLKSSEEEFLVGWVKAQIWQLG
nr:methyltransferase domain-containing protein [Algoriphagus sp. AGSA1]